MRDYTRKHADHINEQRRARRTTATLKREKEWRKKNHDKWLEYKRQYRQRHPEKCREMDRRYVAANRERVRERVAAYGRANRKHLTEMDKKKYWANPEKYRAIAVGCAQRRRARKASVPQEDINREAVFSRDDWQCGLCSKHVDRKDASLDHVIPLSRGGWHVESNLQLAHLNCNKAKGNRWSGQLELLAS